MDFQKLLTAFDSLSKPTKTYTDNSAEFWKPTVDKAGNGSAIIRFLPSKNIDDIPFVRLFSHGFKNEENGRWYIENSLSTLGQPDPLGEYNQEQWNTGIAEKQEEVRGRKRKLHYISNILVIKDPGNPENEGKVFKFKYGKKILEKIIAASKPNLDLDPEAKPIHAFDPISGANFALTQEKVSGWPNYDKSVFAAMSPLFKGDQKKIDAVLEQCYDINEEIAPSKFKSYDELKKKLYWVLGLDSAVAQKAADDKFMEDMADDVAVAEAATTKRQSPPKVTSVTDEDDDALFQSLLNDD